MRLMGHQISGFSILYAVSRQISLTVFSVVVSSWVERYESVLRNRIKFHFMESGIEHLLRLDLPTLQDPEVRSKILSPNSLAFDNPGDAWFALEGLKAKATSILDLITQCTFLIGTVRNQRLGPIFVAMCVAQPFLTDLTEIDLWRSSYFQHSQNEYFLRMKALYGLISKPQFRRDILSDDVGHFIKREFRQARFNLGDTSTDHLGLQWKAQKSVILRLACAFLAELPMFFFCIQSFFSPKNLAASSMTILQQTAMSIQWSIRSILKDSSSISEVATSFKDLYAASEVENKLKDGYLPCPIDKGKVEFGAEIEFCHVSFTYPGSMQKAINDVSFRVGAGQMAVIVGVNGSGKSSMIKLFNRLYDPTDGKILVDGLPLQSYKISDIRRSMAILCQEHPPYPVSLRDNIAFGLPDEEVTDEDVELAARQGGASDFILKLQKGFKTTLDPVDATNCHYHSKMPAAFKELMEKKEKPTAISGGESQRLAASRTFLRLGGGNIRLLAVDEPTSALDPQAEYELLQRLREQREGKTVIFITHRFGNLTKYADTILCMKAGHLVEQGTHSELMAKQGEYYRLHEIQAQAFAKDLEIDADEFHIRGDSLDMVKQIQEMKLLQAAQILLPTDSKVPDP
ncbi:P-loop containing nucleoside triphosphate hydrolase protein [Rickenella mellea]|uniref:P-loop containing nucleoside triphosphate hydrolase protein n=1 Tax=Rickenella mellea TaxID=50990 RepID=A0A4Y7Q2H2_9AGAM|nr:P-loop containing nucleoside triphosphate hydrolase protein [Rickenella mellea]